VRITERVLADEGTIAAVLADNPAWMVWGDIRDHRNPHHPTMLALHPPTGTTVAIYIRPRHLHPSEAPNPSWLPPTFIPVVWHPGLRAAIHAWLIAPQTTPPGLIKPTNRPTPANR
jgi:hypothetical protein